MNENSENRLSNLSATKHLLLQKWKQGQLTIISQDHQAISRRQQYDSVPLSFAQEGLWFIDQLVGGNRAYNISFATRTYGNLNINVLQDSLNVIIRRHEALRTTFSLINDQPTQIITSSLSLQLSPVDIQALPADEKEDTALRLILEEANHVFDLTQGPLIRAKLLRLDQDNHILLLMLHHTICDGWSLGILNQELWTLYSAFLQGRHSPLPELPIQYADFAVWQRQHLQGEKLEAELNYWKQVLADAPSFLQLPTDHHRPSIQTFLGKQHLFELPEILTRKIKALSQNEGTTLFMTLLAAFQLLLSYYSKQNDILIGTPIANRQHVETEKLIGFFANTLVLRTNLAGCSCFRDLLGRVREVTLKALTHQDVPFEHLVAELQIERDMSKNPLFQVMFNFGSDVPLQPVTPPGLLLEGNYINVGTAMFDLWLSMWESDNKLKGIMEFNTDLFDLPTIQRMLGHFQSLLEIVTVDPDQTLNFSLLTLSEEQQILEEWNATERKYSQDTHLHQLFEAQVEQRPEAIAVVFEDHHLTYNELNKRAHQLAHYLQTLGVKPEWFVGLYMERSLEMIVGILGILKAGGAYVPLDPHYPQERLAFMTNDMQAPILLTQDHLRQRITAESSLVISLNTEWPMISREDPLSLINVVRPENVAYIIYTSGSTGKPKGAMNTHSGICNRLLWMQEAYQLTETDRVLQKTPFSFDVSVWEFFWPLSTEATLVIAPPEGHRDSSYLVKLIAEQQITTIHFVPSMLDIFLKEDGIEQCSCLRRVISSGEALSFEVQERFYAHLGKTTLYNLYGPTEAAVDVTHWTCIPSESGGRRHTIPIGRPITNIQIYLLDQHLNPVPVGVEGELHINGVGLARGYLYRPDITAERFIPHPFSLKPGARLYKTGDVARYLPDGNIEFLRRLDHQVKLRGLRIELGEIESVLIQHSLVQDAIVTVHNNSSGSKQLIAYIVLHSLSDHEHDAIPASADEHIVEHASQWQQNQHKNRLTSQLLAYLTKQLPEYMVPALIISLEAWPLTPNGKIDRRALPAPDVTDTFMQEHFVAPRTPIEHMLASIWSQVLDFEPIGVYHNFFALGGDSIRSIQIVSRAKHVGFHITSRMLFEHQTIASLATVVQMKVPLEHVDGEKKSPVDIALSVTSPFTLVDQQVYQQLSEVLGDIEDIYPLSPMQQNMFAQRRHTGNAELYWLGTAPISMRGTQLNISAYEEAWQLVVDQHPAMRTSFVWENLEEPLQAVHKQAKISIEHFDWRNLSPIERQTQIDEYVQVQRRNGSDLTAPSHSRLALFRTADYDYYLMRTFNYMLLDGWSSTLVKRDFDAFYEALCDSKRISLELPRHYRDYISWIKQQDLGKAEIFWRKNLQDITSTGYLFGAQESAPPRAADPFSKEVLTLSIATTTALQALSRQRQLTVATFLYGAWALLLSCYSGKEDIIFGNASSGRPADLVGSEYVVGFFNNILPLRVQVTPQTELLSWLVEIQTQMIDLRDYEYSPMRQIKQWAAVPDTLPLFESYVVYENFPEYQYAEVGKRSQRDLGIWTFNVKKLFVPTEYPLRVEFWPFQPLQIILSCYQQYASNATLTHVLAQMKKILESMVQHPNQRVGDLMRIIDVKW